MNQQNLEPIKNLSEFRQDIVSGDWVLIATGRKKRPHELVVNNKRQVTPKDKCPFENPQASGGANPDLIRLNDKGDDWRIQILPNLYPAVYSDKSVKTSVFKDGPYFNMAGAGYHDVVITRDHNNNFANLSLKEATEVLEVMQERYRIIAKDERIVYISIFHNWGPTAGASIYHPHYQIISVPVLPSGVSHSLSGSGKYFAENNKCAHCAILEKEIKEQKRIIYENENAISFLPFVSREPFEMRIFPKKHLAFFEDSDKQCLADVADALKQSLLMLEKKLNDVDYNFFIRTAPVKNKENYSYYHWHIRVQPKISMSAGFELSTGIEITVVDPDDAAAFLKT